MKRALFLLTLAASACIADKDEDLGQTSDPIYTTVCLNEYYSDATYAYLVGYWGGVCGTNITQWGIKTVYRIRTCETCGEQPSPGL